VIDPLYSLAKNRPEMMAFRVYPPEHNARANETPDGSIVTDDRRRVELWGACWNRYYKLEIDYFMSALSQQTLGVLKNKFLWQNAFCGAAAGEYGGVARAVGGVLQAVDSLPSAHHAGRGSHSMLYCARELAADSRGATALGALASGAAEEGVRKASTREKVGVVVCDL
jgi:COP9 signalosome complex subunit 5